MKKKIYVTILCMLILTFCCSVSLVACDLFDSGKKEAQKYTIQYTDDDGTHTVDVTEGMPYSISSIPSRYGYKFVGLFDAEEGGTQYVSASGGSLSVFDNGRNMVLFPQFEPLIYTIKFDYGDATATGERSREVKFNSQLAEFPADVQADHKVFIGWYAFGNYYGEQLIADAQGQLLFTNFDRRLAEFANSDNEVTFYAKFETEKYTVHFYSKNGMQQLYTVENVEYGTQFGAIKPLVRSETGIVLTWSARQGGYGENVADSELIEEDIDFFELECGNILTADYTESTNHKIVKGKLRDNPYDTFTFQSLFGYKLQSMLDVNLKTLKFTIVVTISEADDGYQEIYLCKSSSVSAAASLWKKDNIEHYPGKYNSSKKDYTYSGSVLLEDCAEGMGWYYSAHGDIFSNHAWYRHKIVVTFTVE